MNNQLTDCISTAMRDIILCLCVCFGTSEGGREEGGERERERDVCVRCWLHVL